MLVAPLCAWFNHTLPGAGAASGLLLYSKFPMSSQGIDVQYVADLARLRLSADEVATFQKQLSDILGYVDQLQKVDVSSVEAITASAPTSNNLRTDELKPSISAEEALANAPVQSDNLFIVPRMVE
ncbi:Asp-tRNA(Asn)/Glu-tRNA(Gln) amidotransferase GatCAB subunit C [Verrucomicrobia bacterium LW23]|nr:Asp-tRNA(Asn)/Glu-tRNA(Gln) amidotransferase GatCAB subunit C [Verrucomicrobia bacterium LW23]